MSIKHDKVTGVILAGGQARRMGGGDKGLINVAGKPMIEYVIDALNLQIEKILINANRNIETYQAYKFPVIPDVDEGYQGPLAGMASCMRESETEYIITAPCDAPLLPDDYVDRMMTQATKPGVEIAVADNGSRLQPVFSLVKVSLLESLRAYLDSGERKIDRWFEKHHMVKVDFSDEQETFENINTMEDVKNLEAQLSK